MVVSIVPATGTGTGVEVDYNSLTIEQIQNEIPKAILLTQQNLVRDERAGDLMEMMLVFAVATILVIQYYFFQPTIALIYVIFILLFLAVRAIRSIPLTAAETTANRNIIAAMASAVSAVTSWSFLRFAF